MRAGDFHSLSSFAGNNNLNLQVPLQTMQAKMSGKKDFQALKQGVLGTGNKYQAMHELYE